MKFTVYILQSKQMGKYYTGYTSRNIEERMVYHLSEHKGFTSKAKDWEIVYTEEIATKSDAMVLEKKIKKRGAKRFLQDKSSI